MKDAEYNASEMRDAEFTAKQLHEVGYTLDEIKSGGYPGIYGTLEYVVSTDNNTDPIINNDSSFIIERTLIIGTIKYKYLFEDNGTTMDGFKLNNWNNLSNLKYIKKYDNIPFSRSGEHFYNISEDSSLLLNNAFLPTSSTDLPTILSNTSFNKTFTNSVITNYGNVGNWDTSNVTDMSYMFLGSKINKPLENWNTSNVMNMKEMFWEAFEFNQKIGEKSASNYTAWDTSKVTDMSGMFGHQPSDDLNSGNEMIFNNNGNNLIFNTSNVENMKNMFQNCKYFNQNLINWNTEKVTDMRNMFLKAELFNYDIKDWKTNNVTNMSNMFSYAKEFNQDIGNWNTSKLTSMLNMFVYAEKYNQSSMGSWDLTNVTNIKNMILNSGLSPENYSQFLINLSNNTTLTNNLNLNFTSQVRINNDLTNDAYTKLTTTKGMTINDGGSFTTDEFNNTLVLLSGTGQTKTISSNKEIYLVDDGGLSKSYSANQNSNMIIEVPEDHKFEITYKTDLEFNRDLLYIHRGDNEQGPIFANFNFETSPNEGLAGVSSSNYKIFIKFSTDSDIETSGFYLKIKAKKINDLTATTDDAQIGSVEVIMDDSVGKITHQISGGDSSLFSLGN